MRNVMKFNAAVVSLMCVLAAPTTSAALQYSTQDGVMRVWGKVEEGDVEALKVHLTPAVQTVVLGGVTGGSWESGRDLGNIIDKAGVATVVHGSCAGWGCSMMFLSGKTRMFSAAGRPESQMLEIPVIPNLSNYTCGGVPCSEMNAWVRQHTKLHGADMEILHKSHFAATTNTGADELVFFPAQAKFSAGNVLHCAREVMEEKKQTFTLADCAPVMDATSLDRGIVTTDDAFSHPSLTVRKELAVPPATQYAALTATLDIHAALNDDCSSVQARFLRFDSPRALVVSDRGACFARSAQSPRPYADAMQACKASKAKCRFYAVDDSVVFVPFDKPLVAAKEDPLEGAAPTAAGARQNQ